MQICPYCFNENENAAICCQRCGEYLTEAKASVTWLVKPEIRLSAHMNWGQNSLPPDAFLVLHVGSSMQEVIVQPRNYIVIGRSYAQATVRPDIDLAPYEGIERGVSRLHAVLSIHNDQVTLADLGSSNGTYLNGSKLVVRKPHAVSSGDEIRLATLVSHIYFVRMSSPVQQ